MMAILVGAGTILFTLGLRDLARAIVDGKNITEALITYSAIILTSLLIGNFILN